MPKVNLTDITVRSLKAPEKGQTMYWDQSLASFGVRVSQGGTKTFLVVTGENRQKTTIGRYGILTLSEARTAAKRFLAEKTLGKFELPPVAFSDALEQYYRAAALRIKERTFKDYKRLINRHFNFGRVLLGNIGRAEIMRRVDKLTNTPSEQNHAFVALKVFLRWSVANELIERNPLEGIGKPARLPSRKRTLTDDELAIVYKAALEFHPPYGQIVALLILTGQRRGEIAGLRWSWINEGGQTITFPEGYTKNKHEHTFPYGNMAANIIAEIPKDGGYLFPPARTHVREKPTTIFNGWAKMKPKFDATFKDVDHFTLHDLRRTFSSNLARLRVPIHITEKILNHTTGTVSGVAAIYNRHTYMEEMAEAISTYENHIATIIAT